MFFLVFIVFYFISTKILNELSAKLIAFLSIITVLIKYFTKKQFKILGKVKTEDAIFTIHEEASPLKIFKVIWYSLISLSVALILLFWKLEINDFDHIYLIIIVNVFYYFIFIFPNNSKIKITEEGIMRDDKYKEMIYWKDMESIERNTESELYILISIKGNTELKIANDPFSLQGHKLSEIENYLRLKIKQKSML